MMEGQIADDDVFSGEPVPLWLEEQFWSEDEIAEMAEVARKDEKEEEMWPESGIANIEEVAYEEEEEMPVAGHSEEALALALLAGSALAIFLVGYLNMRSNNAERRGARI
jgi:hypothetical protein